jgi:hypothetical protein
MMGKMDQYLTASFLPWLPFGRNIGVMAPCITAVFKGLIIHFTIVIREESSTSTKGLFGGDSTTNLELFLLKPCQRAGENGFD